MPPKSPLNKAPKPEKSQAELRKALEQKLSAEKPHLDRITEEYKEALLNDTFEDKDGEEEGSGEKRKTEMQQRILSTVTRAERMKQKLDSGEPLTSEIDPDALEQSNEQFLTSTFEGWYNKQQATEAKQEAVLTSPDSQDYKTLSESTETKEFGKYTLNPETQGLDFEKLKVFIPDLSQFNNKPLHEVMKYVNDTYGATHHIPGIEYWKWLIENPGKNPPNQDLKDGKYYFFPGSVLRDRDGIWYVPFARWNGAALSRSASWLTHDWSAVYRVVLLEK